MDAADFADEQRDEELAVTPEALARLAAREERKDIHTALPGIVQSFDATTQTARVRLAIKRLWADEAIGWQPLPDLVNCPVMFPRFGNFVITGPVAEGDECLVVFAERAIDEWHHAGGVQQQSEFRMHDLSDGFVIPGCASKPKAGQVAGGAAADALEIRTLDGATVVRIEANQVVLGAAAGAQMAALGETLQAILDVIRTHTHPTVGPSAELAAVPTWEVRATKVKVR